MSEMNRDKWIEKARQFLYKKWAGAKLGYPGTVSGEKYETELMADFAIEAVTLNGWREIKSEDDLPEKDGEYLVSERTGCDGMVVETYQFRNSKFSYFDPEAGWKPYDDGDFVAWMPFPAPFVKDLHSKEKTMNKDEMEKAMEAWENSTERRLIRGGNTVPPYALFRAGYLAHQSAVDENGLKAEKARDWLIGRMEYVQLQGDILIDVKDGEGFVVISNPDDDNRDTIGAFDTIEEAVEAIGERAGPNAAATP